MAQGEEGAKPVDLGTELAMSRTILALERTMLAWIRTSLALLGFGFTFAKYIHSMLQHSALKELQVGSPRNLGIILMALGVAGIAGGVIQYVHAHRHMKHLAPNASPAIWSPALIMAVILLIASTVLTVGVMLKLKML